MRAREAAKLARLKAEVASLKEELRIKDARMAGIPPHRRPHYPPKERLAILLLRAVAGWNAEETARRFDVTPETIGNWLRRLDEKGEDALVQTRVPVNRYPDFVGALVQGLKRTVPTMGSKRIASTLARAGLHLARSTVKRLAKRTRPAPPTPPSTKGGEPKGPKRAPVVTARHAHHVWHIDITQMPIAGGFWTPWLPFSLPTCWPFCWHLVVVVDHFSRAAVARGVFKREPSAADVCMVLDRGVEFAGRAPRHLISDQGRQFTGKVYAEWCEWRGAKPRFGALGKHGSIAVIERFFRSLKEEGLRRILIPFGMGAMTAEVDCYLKWYASHRPHSFLAGATPSEVLKEAVPASKHVAMEVRPRYPLRSRRAGTARRRRPRKRVELQVTFVGGHRHLPVVALQLAN